MSCKRLDIMEFHCHGSWQLKKYTLADCSIGLLTFSAALPFITSLYMTWSVLQSWFYRCLLKLQYFMGKINNFSSRLPCISVWLGSWSLSSSLSSFFWIVLHWFPAIGLWTISPKSSSELSCNLVRRLIHCYQGQRQALCKLFYCISPQDPQFEMWEWLTLSKQWLVWDFSCSKLEIDHHLNL